MRALRHADPQPGQGDDNRTDLLVSRAASSERAPARRLAPSRARGSDDLGELAPGERSDRALRARGSPAGRVCAHRRSRDRSRAATAYAGTPAWRARVASSNATLPASVRSSSARLGDHDGARGAHPRVELEPVERSRSVAGVGSPAPAARIESGTGRLVPAAVAQAGGDRPRRRARRSRRPPNGRAAISSVREVTIGHPSSNGRKKAEPAIDRRRRAGGARQQPRQAVLPGARADEARPRQLLRRVRGGGRARPARPPDGDEALGRRRGGQAVLPEARARQRAGVAADGDRDVPERPPRARAGAERRRAPRLGRQPRRDRLEPVGGAAHRPRPSRRAARRPRPAAGRRRSHEVREVALCVREVLDEHGLLGFPKTSGSRGIHIYVRLEPRARLPAGAHARRSRSRARSSGACPAARPAAGGRRNARACSSTTTRTRATARSPRPTPCARCPTRACPVRWIGTRSPTSSRRS